MKTDRPSSIQRRFDLVEVSLIVVLAVVIGWIVGRPRIDNPVQSVTEIEAFRDKYGPDHYSEREEEWLIRDYFQNRREGIFVDVGANHYRLASKTYYLESQLGWSGLAIEPQKEFSADYAQHRPRTKFLPFFVSDASNETAKLYITRRSSLVASGDKNFVQRFGSIAEARDVPTITLNDLLVSEGIHHVDFLSMDIELHEPEALRGFDIGRFKPSLVCIEGLAPVRQAILDYFARNNYVLVGKYMWVDLENLYFVPLDTREPQQSAQKNVEKD